jgi:hypothetical protein
MLARFNAKAGEETDMGPTIQSRTEDHLAIERLIFKYGMAIDNLDSVAFSDCFAREAVMLTPTGEMTDLSAEHVAQIMAQMSYERTLHNVHNHMYVIKENNATGMTYCVASHVGKKDGEWFKLDQYIRYQDELIKQDGRWLFLKRRYEPIFTTEVPVQNVVNRTASK